MPVDGQPSQEDIERVEVLAIKLATAGADNPCFDPIDWWGQLQDREEEQDQWREAARYVLSTYRAQVLREAAKQLAGTIDYLESWSPAGSTDRTAVVPRLCMEMAELNHKAIQAG